jgi:hypothetical protein
VGVAPNYRPEAQTLTAQNTHVSPVDLNALAAPAVRKPAWEARDERLRKEAKARLEKKSDG